LTKIIAKHKLTQFCLTHSVDSEGQKDSIFGRKTYTLYFM